MERLERLHDHGVLEMRRTGRRFRLARTAGFRDPPAWGHSVWNKNTREPGLRSRDGLGYGRLSGNHRIQKRQRKGYARSFQNRAPREVFLGYEHYSALLMTILVPLAAFGPLPIGGTL